MTEKKAELTPEEEAMLAESIKELEQSLQSWKEILEYGDKLITRHQQEASQLQVKRQY